MGTVLHDIVRYDHHFGSCPLPVQDLFDKATIPSPGQQDSITVVERLDWAAEIRVLLVHPQISLEGDTVGDVPKIGKTVGYLVVMKLVDYWCCDFKEAESNLEYKGET